MPFAVHVLGAAVFALGTSEFMLSGLLPEVAGDLDVSIPTAGLLISAFAIGMVVGAPLLAVATRRLPKRLTLAGLLAVFALGHVVGALAPGYALLFACRVVSALACAGFWAVGAAVVVSLVPEEARARAMAVVIGGLSVANVTGVPGGAALGQTLGWRAAFWTVGALAVIGLVGVLLFVPATPAAPEGERTSLRDEVRVYRDLRVWLAIGTTALMAAGTFCFFSYLAPLLTDVSGLDEDWVPLVLVLYGVGAFTGTLLGGRLADAHMFGTLYTGLLASAAVLVAVAVTAESAVAVAVLSGLLGIATFLCAPGLNTRILNVAGAAAPTLAGATTTSAFNTGNTLGPWAGGVVIDAGLGYTWTAWLGALLLLMAFTGAWLQARTSGDGRGAAVADEAGRPVRRSEAAAHPAD
ncbi:Cmx/CmrA family chloramphenicol efflux MFS transporter [Streptomyces sp. RFCAC02]|uniref:Cmx/CmrA family chloramphenicol efflux MFS transporter n=1 Tax=Streptomyces sp. RFCAC02 TaxID=2499143 RepID=UPI001F0FAFC2|nr:Cmx/CmrA family chloramphenicol efflux MFS transporter [Streptomyces sp. RFCAC02]